MTMHFFIELITLVFFLLTVAHCVHTRGTTGAWLMGSLLFAGFVRENFVILQKYLYGFAPLELMLGKAPLIASIIWGYSIYLSLVWAEEIRDERLEKARPRGRLLLLVGLFMVALAWFYEPFLKLIEMARWEDGTFSVFDVPLIAMVGYPTFAAAFLGAWGWAMETSRSPVPRALTLGVSLTLVALAHAAGLQGLKDVLGW